MSITIVFDCIRANIARAPAGLLAGYTTGSADIAWTAADWTAHPGAVRIDQDPAASDGTADVLDVEAGAATPAHVPGWAKRALASYRAGTRPGQRSPLVYVSAANVTSVANVLTGAKMADGSVGLFIANWNLNQAQAAADVLAASGPFPVHGLQFKDAGDYDIDVFSSAWLGAVSQAPPKPGAATPAPGNLRQTVESTGSAVSFTWHPVAGQDTYHWQLEWYKGGFGWVLSGDTQVTGTSHVMALAPRTSYRWRVAAGKSGYVWAQWEEFTTPLPFRDDPQTGT